MFVGADSLDATVKSLRVRFIASWESCTPSAARAAACLVDMQRCNGLCGSSERCSERACLVGYRGLPMGSSPNSPFAPAASVESSASHCFNRPFKVQHTSSLVFPYVAPCHDVPRYTWLMFSRPDSIFNTFVPPPPIFCHSTFPTRTAVAEALLRSGQRASDVLDPSTINLAPVPDIYQAFMRTLLKPAPQQQQQQQQRAAGGVPFSAAVSTTLAGGFDKSSKGRGKKGKRGRGAVASPPAMVEEGLLSVLAKNLRA